METFLTSEFSKHYKMAFKGTMAPVESALHTCKVCPSFREEHYSRYLDLSTCMNTWKRENICKEVLLFVLNYEARFSTRKRKWEDEELKTKLKMKKTTHL